jgi:rubrerythrin
MRKSKKYSKKRKSMSRTKKRSKKNRMKDGTDKPKSIIKYFYNIMSSTRSHPKDNNFLLDTILGMTITENIIKSRDELSLYSQSCKKLSDMKHSLFGAFGVAFGTKVLNSLTTFLNICREEKINKTDILNILKNIQKDVNVIKKLKKVPSSKEIQENVEKIINGFGITYLNKHLGLTVYDSLEKDTKIDKISNLKSETLIYNEEMFDPNSIYMLAKDDETNILFLLLNVYSTEKEEHFKEIKHINKNIKTAMDKNPELFAEFLSFLETELGKFNLSLSKTRLWKLVFSVEA